MCLYSSFPLVLFSFLRKFQLEFRLFLFLILLSKNNIYICCFFFVVRNILKRMKAFFDCFTDARKSPFEVSWNSIETISFSGCNLGGEITREILLCCSLERHQKIAKKQLHGLKLLIRNTSRLTLTQSHGLVMLRLYIRAFLSRLPLRLFILFLIYLSVRLSVIFPPFLFPPSTSSSSSSFCLVRLRLFLRGNFIRVIDVSYAGCHFLTFTLSFVCWSFPFVFFVGPTHHHHCIHTSTYIFIIRYPLFVYCVGHSITPFTLSFLLYKSDRPLSLSVVTYPMSDEPFVWSFFSFRMPVCARAYERKWWPNQCFSIVYV